MNVQCCTRRYGTFVHCCTPHDAIFTSCVHSFYFVTLCDVASFVEGNYMYYNSLGVMPGRLARLSLPIKTPSTSSCFIFYYSMVSSGQLKVSGHVQSITSRHIGSSNSYLLLNKTVFKRTRCLSSAFSQISL